MVGAAVSHLPILRELRAVAASYDRKERKDRRTSQAEARRQRRRQTSADLRAARLLATGGRSYVNGAGPAARALLVRLLQQSRAVEDVVRAAASLGISRRTLERAARGLGVRFGRGPRDVRGRFGPARWWLRPPCTSAWRVNGWKQR